MFTSKHSVHCIKRLFVFLITIYIVNREVLIMTAIDLENITSMIYLGTILFQQGPDIILLCIFISHSTDVICSVFPFPLTQALPLFFFIWTRNTRMNNDKFHWRIYVQPAKSLHIYDNIYIKVRTYNNFDQGRITSIPSMPCPSSTVVSFNSIYPMHRRSENQFKPCKHEAQA